VLLRDRVETGDRTNRTVILERGIHNFCGPWNERLRLMPTGQFHDFGTATRGRIWFPPIASQPGYRRW
jgi:hypothetical protein